MQKTGDAASASPVFCAAHPPGIWEKLALFA